MMYNKSMRYMGIDVQKRDDLGVNFPKFKPSSKESSTVVEVRILIHTVFRTGDRIVSIQVPVGLPVDKLDEFKAFCLTNLKNKAQRPETKNESTTLSVFLIRLRNDYRFVIENEPPVDAYIDHFVYSKNS